MTPGTGIQHDRPAPPGTVYDLARRLAAAGVCVLPIRVDKPKAPALPSWEEYETRRPTEAELAAMFRGRRRGIAAVGGSVSGGLECLDFDEPGLFDRWAADVEAARPGLVARLVVVRTPKGGAHAWFRSAGCEPNQVLAARPPTADELRERPKLKSVQRIETRGAGGYALLPGSPPECHETGGTYEYAAVGRGDLARVDVLAADERDLLVGLARALNTLPTPPKVRPAEPRPRADDGGLPPGDDFDRRGSWRDVLEPHGWALERGTWDEGRLTRPGKGAGVSATVGTCRGPGDEPLLHVFSSAAGMEPGTYGRFRAYAELAHAGSWRDAARALAARGFGDRRSQPGWHHANGAPAANGQAVPPWAAKPTGELPDPGITAAALMELELPPARFAVDGLLCEGLTVFGGRPKMGKSWLALLIAWAVAGGHTLDGRPCKPGHVLFLALEDTRRRLQARMRMLRGALGWEPPAGLDLRTAWPRADQGGLPHLHEWLTDHKGEARLVVVDTIARFRKPAKGVGNAYAEDYQAFGEIKQLADLHATSAMAVHHTRKQPAEDPFDELSGTLGSAGAADGLMILDRKRGADTGRLYVTGRDLADATIPLTLDRESFRWMLGPAAEGIDMSGRHAAESSNRLDQCKAWLLDFLKDYAHPSAEITQAGQAAGFNFYLVRDAKAALGPKGEGVLANKNFANGQGKDWWTGVGAPEGWRLRPGAGPRVRESESPALRNGQPAETLGRDRRSESADGPEVWPG